MFESSREALIQIRRALDFAPNAVVAVIIIALAAILALAIHYLLMRLLARLLHGRPATKSIVAAIQGPMRLALIVLALGIALPTAPLSAATSEILVKLLVITVIGLIGWAIITAMNTAADLYLLRFRLDTADNLLARKHVTQVRILLRTADVLVVIVTVSAALMTFDAVRQYGVSLFASAGVAGLVVGLAARPVLTNLLAGVQLAITQPIRLDDAVQIEGEWGHIEEITATYVVIRLWDLRRLVVPLSYFLERPFQNWTREGSEIYGSVILAVDYTTPLALLREKAQEIAEQSPLWNHKLLRIEVTDSKENFMEVRVVVSASSARGAWSLRCELREKLIAFLVETYPGAFPRRQPGVSSAAGDPAQAPKADEAPPREITEP